MESAASRRCFIPKYLKHERRPGECCAPGLGRTGTRRKKRNELLGRYSEISNKRTALFGAAPGGPEALARKVVGQRVGRHGMSRLGERLIPDLFVAAEVVILVQGAGLDLG